MVSNSWLTPIFSLFLSVSGLLLFSKVQSHKLTYEMPLHFLVYYCKTLSVELPWKLICCFKQRPGWSRLCCLDWKESEGLCSPPRLYTDCLRIEPGLKTQCSKCIFYCILNILFYHVCLFIFVNVYTLGVID